MPSNKTLQNLGESIEAYVASFVEDEGSDDPTTLGRGFVRWCCETIFELSSENTADATEVGGKDDNSMDAIFDGGSGLVILQCKYNSHDWSEVAKFKLDMDRLTREPPRSGRQSVQEAAAKIRDAVRQGDPVRFLYLTNSRFTGQNVVKVGQLHPREN